MSDVVVRGAGAGRYPEEHGAVGRLRGGRPWRLRVRARSWQRPDSTDIGIETTRVYSVDDARTFLAGEGFDVDALAQEVEGTFVSAFVRATKPVASACCGPSCCS